MVAGLAAGLDPNRYRIHAWFLREGGPLVRELEASQVQVRVVPWRGGRWDLAGAYRFWRSLHLEKFALVHQHVRDRITRLLVRARGGAKIIVHLHCSTLETEGVRSPLSSLAADRVIAVSRSMALDVAGSPARVVYPGVPIEETPGVPVPADGSAGEHTVVGTACRLVPIKGVDNLIRAIAALRDGFPTLRLEIAGAGPDQDRLEALVRASGLADRVAFLGWQERLAPIMSRWAVFALPSMDEGLPIVVLEAMAASLPVVTTHCGGLPEVVEEGRTGWLVPPNDSAALAERLRALLLDSDQRRAMGSAGRTRVQERFSLTRMVAEIAQIYDETIEGEKSR
jgi:glycosyltransferase involved in cell wall biosynthesis